MLGRGSLLKEIAIASCDCDTLSRLTPTAALRYIQDVSGEAFERLDLPRSVMLEKYGLVFIIAAHAVRFTRPVMAGEELSIITHPMGSRGPHLFRQVEFFDKSGERVVEAQTDWILMEWETGKPQRATALPVELESPGGWQPFCDPSKLRIPHAAESAGFYTVVHEDTDVNVHLNNTIYARIMLSCHEDAGKKPLREFFIRYHRQVREGEKIDLFKGYEDGRLLSTGYLNGELSFTSAFVHF
ncbi:MAG: hypothetical protein IKL92_00505 [Oscillospiraceae bacterium]|nr:hypothetical protein [Oscillospiraceae bacterium]